MLFLVLTYRLCIETNVEVSFRIDHMVVALHTIDPILIKDDENPMALQQAQPPMPNTFMLEP